MVRCERIGRSGLVRVALLTVAIWSFAPESWAQTCTPPPRDCSGTATECRELIPFTPVAGPGYDNYPINGETAANQYRSYARRELVMLVKHAAALTACVAAGWTPGNGKPIGLGDMSEANGAIPGTSTGSPGHPKGSHTNGRDMDIAYFQLRGDNNYLRPVCPHADNHCTGAPDNLDVRRTALFIGAMLASPRTRVIGVDGRIKPLIIPALKELCGGGTLPKAACDRIGRIAAETSNTGQGWFRHHHHHLHISLHTGDTPSGPPQPTESIAPAGQALDTDLRELEQRRAPGHIMLEP